MSLGPDGVLTFYMSSVVQYAVGDTPAPHKEDACYPFTFIILSVTPSLVIASRAG